MFGYCDETVKAYIVLIFLQLLTNIILDKTRISEKYFTSSGTLIFIVYSALWGLTSIFISYNSAKGDLWFLTLWLPLLTELIIGTILLFLFQLLYSYSIKRFILKK